MVNPLDKTYLTANSRNEDGDANIFKDFDNFQYFLGIVPTVYVDNTVIFGGVLVTNQYAVTEFQHSIDPRKPDAMPGLFIKYDIGFFM